MPIDPSLAFVPVNIAVLTVSDTRDFASDRSGDTLVARIEAAGHRLVARALLRDEASLIEAQLRDWIAAPEVDCVITTGGTGITGRDVTPEAFARVLELWQLDARHRPCNLVELMPRLQEHLRAA
ncbi:MAG: hypothetical protein B7Z53_02420 [Rhodospirillales bacterium 12-71-4]|nr:MAG: hypothetical protein B7Z53_02420 [Rhodospirillales bacterium 12-71-4]